MANAQRFSGLRLTSKDRTEVARRRSKDVLRARVWRRLEMLRLLDGGATLQATADALDCYRREVSRVAKRYLSSGLEQALSEDARPGRAAKLDSAQQAAVVALVCSPAPTGQARWTIRLIAEEVVRRGIVDEIGRETVRTMLATHDLKPWREKNVVRSADRPAIRRSNGGRVAAVRAQIQVGRASGRAR